jgi:hypothetical protein
MAVLQNQALPPVVVITDRDPVRCANVIRDAWQAALTRSQADCDVNGGFNPRWFVSDGTSAVSIAAGTTLNARIGTCLQTK